MKKFVTILMTFILLCSLALPTSAQFATALGTLGLFKGTENGFELEKSLTRAEAITMLVRVLGKAEEAEQYGKTHPFSDVAPWADGYVSYAFDMGLTNGISDTLFGAENAVESNMYLTFLLRAMGFKDGEGADFIWEMPYALAADHEMLPPEADLVHFTRRDAVILTSAALFAKEKAKETTLADRLMAEGVFSAEEWQSAFPEDPFSEYKAINRAIGEVLPGRKGAYNEHTFTQYMLFETEVLEDGIRTLVLVSDCSYAVYENNELSPRGTGLSVKNILLDKETYAVLSDALEGQTFAEWFPASAIGTETNNLIWKGLNTVLGKKVEKAIAAGELAWRQPSYEEALEQIKQDGISYITETIETDVCTILVGTLGGVMHGPHGWVRLLYKPGSSMGEGKMVSLPLPSVNAWGGTEAPEDLTVSEDGKTATYSFFFESDMIFDPGLPTERVIHEAGTYQYTTDLASGKTTLEIIK